MATAETIDLEELKRRILSIGKKEKVHKPFNEAKPKKADYPDYESYQKAYRHYQYKMRYDNDPEFVAKCKLKSLYQYRLKKLAKTADGARAQQ